jgi:protein required for attachment to host cells
MAEDLLIPHDALILVADGGKALILRNEGTPMAPRLVVEKTIAAPANPPDRAQSADKQGRVFKGDRRAATEETDRHDLAERRFAATVADAFDAEAEAARGAALLIVAPAPTLAVLRAVLPQALRARVIAEVAKDLVNHPADGIRKVLAGA